MKRNFVLAALSLLLAVTAISCGSKSPFPGYKATESGLYYKKIVKGNGDALKLGDIIRVKIAYYTHDSLLFTSEKMPEPLYDQVQESIFKGDWFEGIRMMNVGDSMSFMVVADSVFDKYFQISPLPHFIEPGSYMRWEIKVEEAMSEEAYEQMMKEKEQQMREQQEKEMADIKAKLAQAEEELTAYLKANKITVEPRESGLVYVCTKKGKGPKPEANQKVKVHYTGKLLDGTVFDSSVERGEPIEFVLGVGMVIRGWDEGIALMSKGEKGVLYIPAGLAYGPQQRGDVIKPYSNLMFEVELVDIN